MKKSRIISFYAYKRVFDENVHLFELFAHNCVKYGCKSFKTIGVTLLILYDFDHFELQLRNLNLLNPCKKIRVS